jgi:EAL domain-containing protein (putative c-di-GMP-specific phosphodiesterase class I)
MGDAIHRVISERDAMCVFQPVVDLKTGRIFAYEALARTKAPEFEGPLALFAAAVAENVTGQLGRMLREMALQGCQGHPLFLNIHPAELNEKWVVQPDDPIFNHTEDVYLEITEAVPLSHFRLCKDMLLEVRGRGVHLVVDDLGAGYSNLKYIADLHPRVVKLDRDLIAGLTKDSRLFKLVSAIVRLCSELESKVVAEGIETHTDTHRARSRHRRGRALRPRLLPRASRLPTASGEVARRHQSLRRAAHEKAS